MPPKVSVVMSVFNGETYLAEAIDSILHQTFADFEFIIIDDGSADSSVDIIQSYSDSRIRLIILEQNMGLASALNQGIHQVRGEYIARMDCDDISLASRFQQQVDYLDTHPDVIVLGSRMLVVDKNKKPLFNFDVPEQHSLIVWNLFLGRTFAHPSVMMRRDVLMGVGGYDESLSTAQDVDLWSRLIGQGQFANLPEQQVLYRSHEKATSIQKSGQQNTVLHATLKGLLGQLWGEDASDEAVAHFLKIRRRGDKFTKRDYEWTSHAMQRLAESMLAKGWMLPEEMPLIEAEQSRLLELIKPHQSIWNRLFDKIKS